MYMRHLVDHVDLLERLAVECLDADLESIVYLLVTLSDSGIHDLVAWETAVMRMQHFVSADAVSSEALAADVLKQLALHVCLYSVVYLDAIFLSHFCGIVHCLAEQVHVVVIEGCGNFI